MIVVMDIAFSTTMTVPFYTNDIEWRSVWPSGGLEELALGW